jgi:general secretion pathway protein G
MFARRNSSTRGFTVAELITVVAIVAILAAVALPVARFGIRRQKELELRDRLRRITDAIDKYHDYMKTPPGPKHPKDMIALGSEGYPKEMEDLVKGLELTDGTKVKFLRDRDLMDPMTGKKDEWITLSTTDSPDTSSSDKANVYEVHSSSTALALDGKTHYNEW